MTVSGGKMAVTPELEVPPDGSYLVTGDTTHTEEQFGLGFTSPDGFHGHRVNMLVSRLVTTGGEE